MSLHLSIRRENVYGWTNGFLKGKCIRKMMIKSLTTTSTLGYDFKRLQLSLQFRYPLNIFQIEPSFYFEEMDTRSWRASDELEKHISSMHKLATSWKSCCMVQTLVFSIHWQTSKDIKWNKVRAGFGTASSFK